MTRARIRLTVLLGLLLVAAIVLFQPLEPRGLAPRPDPARDYAGALERLAVLQAADSVALMPGGATIALLHGQRTGRVVVLLHGLTNCPAQFDSIARVLQRGGANVLVPRLPRHGLADRMTPALADADARELAEFTDRVVDLAAGLGDTLTVSGLSIGGVMAAWAAQSRPEVQRAVPIAPLFGVTRAPGMWTPVVARLTLLLPNRFLWWDDARREDLPGPRHVYPRFSTRSVSASLWLGGAALTAASEAAPAAHEIVMVTVGGDVAADNGMAAEMVRRWRARGAEVRGFQFPADQHLNHDVVDPEQVGGDPARTYPVLLDLLGPQR